MESGEYDDQRLGYSTDRLLGADGLTKNAVRSRVQGDGVADKARPRVREELQSQAAGGRGWEGDQDLAALAWKEAVFTEKGVTFSEDG
jgi:hypothetical protein